MHLNLLPLIITAMCAALSHAKYRSDWYLCDEESGVFCGDDDD
jgi:hypothetical protein